MRTLLFSLLLTVTTAFAAGGGPAPAPKETVTFTQGNSHQTLPTISPMACVSAVGGVIRAKVGNCPINGGSYAQFPLHGGDVSMHWSVQDACPPRPAPLTQHANCPAGTKGAGWTQTAVYNSAPPPACWALGPYLPTTAPDGVCVPISTGLQPLVPQAQLLAISKPARGAPFTTQFATTETRVTDHAVDRPGSELARNDYSRRMPFNADKSRFFVYETGGAWLVYKTNPLAFEKQLSGPGGDAEMQWSPTDPDKLYYMPTNGGCCLYELTVSTNTHTTYYDMAAQAQAALGPQADRLWTRSEGSPSEDNRVWSFDAQHYNSSTGNFDTKGYIAFDVVAHTVLRAVVTTADIDHISTSASGRYMVPSGATTYAIRISDGATCTLRNGGEHSDLIKLTNGHDGYWSVDYQTSLGDMFWIDIDQCFIDGHATRHVPANLHVYQNALWGTNGVSAPKVMTAAMRKTPLSAGKARQKTVFMSAAPTDACAGHCSFHFSGRAYGRPGFVLMSNYGVPQSPIALYAIDTDTIYGIGVTMDDDENYWDEVQAAMSRDGHSILFNDNFGTSLNVDAYRIDLP